MGAINRKRLCQIIISITLISTINACTAFDPLDSTGETLNRNATDYANDAILMNIVRSQLYEPLSFITITGVTGVSSATGNIAFGGFTLGPAKPPLTWLLGPFSAMRTNSNSFNVSVVDDPASFAALLAPVNPAVIGFFINQGYPRELLFFLLTDRLRRVEKDSNGKIIKVVSEYFNDPDHNTDAVFGAFIGMVATLLRRGLTAEIDITATPAGRAMPLSKFCMDSSLPPPNFVASPPKPRPANSRVPAAATLPANSGASMAAPQPANSGAPAPTPLPPSLSASCENAPWIATQNTAPSGPSSGGSSGGGTAGAAGAVSAMTVAPNGVLWAALGNQNAIARVDPDGSVKEFPLPAPPKPSKPPSAGLAAFEFDDDGNHYQLFTRSTYGAYNYIGAILRNNADIDNLQPDGAGYQGMVRVAPSADCFARVVYRNIQYCVPVDAARTKRLFALLHQLQQLNTAPSNTPTTLTIVPG